MQNARATAHGTRTWTALLGLTVLFALSCNGRCAYSRALAEATDRYIFTVDEQVVRDALAEVGARRFEDLTAVQTLTVDGPPVTLTAEGESCAIVFEPARRPGLVGRLPGVRPAGFRMRAACATDTGSAYEDQTLVREVIGIADPEGAAELALEATGAAERARARQARYCQPDEGPSPTAEAGTP